MTLTGQVPRKRSRTRYFNFTSFQLLIENFAAVPPAFLVSLARSSAALPHFLGIFEDGLGGHGT